MDKEEKGQETKETEDKEKTYSETEHKGVINDLQGERKTRQDAEFKLSQSQTQVDSLTKEINELKKSSEEKESKKSVIIGEGEDYLTKKEGRDIETKVRDSIKNAQDIVKENTEKAAYKQNYDKSTALAKKKYADRTEIGLDWDAVYQGALRQIGGRKYKGLDIYTSADPGEELYQEGLKDPEIKAKYNLAKNEKILDTMGDRKVDKKGLTGATGSKDSEFFTPEEVSLMDPATAQRNLPKVLKSAKHWEALQKKK